MLGAGVLVGVRVAISCLLGSIIAWGMLGPLAKSQGWAPGPIMSYADGARGWVLWTGAAIMVAEALTSLVLSWRTFASAFKHMPSTKDMQTGYTSEDIPNRWWMLGLLGASIVTIVVAQTTFDIAWWMTIMAIALSAILANVAVRSTGETDWNPIGGMGKVTQLAFGAVSPGSTSTNLMAAGITGAGASQAGDMMHDLKAGHLLGASPRKQFISQLCGIAAGVLFVVPLYYLFDAAFKVGTPTSDLPAPAAHAWKAVAVVLSKGLDAIPKNAGWAALCGGIFGMALPIIRKLWPKAAPYVPSGLGFGLAFLIPSPKYFVTMFFGAMFLVWWQRKRPDQAKRFMYPVACGLIAGEGLMGVVKAVLIVLGVKPIF
jgi:OPT family oligopeptide transporter